MSDAKVVKSDAEWRAQLGADRYAVCRQAATESPFSGKWYRHHAPGTYVCAGCGSPLFASTAKFDSPCGWPSFCQPFAATAVSEHDDRTHGMHRIEVRCARCASHLGHVFPDGPAPTGLRYCINSLALDFQPA